MRKFALIVILAFLIIGSTFSRNTLVIYTYDSFASGIAKVVIPKFERMYGCEVKVYSFGDAGNALMRVLMEGDKTKADILLGLDQNMIIDAFKKGIFEPYKPLNHSLIKYPEFLDERWRVVPYDFGAIAIVYDSEEVKDPPKSFRDLLDGRWRRSIIIEDPRTSSTGRAFLIWTVAVFGGDGFVDFWRKLKPNILTVTAGWDEAFQLFEAGEAPMMVSYATDGAYSYYAYKSTRYKAVIPEEGAFVQVEYAGILRFSKNKELAKRFMEFLLMDQFQSEIPLNQWMYPVTDVELPDVYKYAATVEKILKVDPSEVEKKMDEWINEWLNVMMEK
ncbi:MAG: thiamine ABC transporter substrate-binding protein [Thermotogae bacterium]|nr:thiamine ABC transporter substrate-binding protein [Thermotogota bacterium]